MGQSNVQISLNRTMALRSHNYINQSRGRCVVMDLLHFGLRCAYFPVLPCTWHRANQSQAIKYTVDTVALGAFQSFFRSVDDTSSSISDAVVELL